MKLDQKKKYEIKGNVLVEVVRGVGKNKKTIPLLHFKATEQGKALKKSMKRQLSGE